MELRSYQLKAIDLIRDAIKSGKRKILVTLPTGAGKTHLMAAIVSGAVNKGNHVAAIVHRRQLVTQMADMFTGCGIESGIIMADEESHLGRPAQIISRDTYHRRLKLDEVEYNPFFVNAEIILIDEAHHALSKTYQSILAHYPDKIVIGVTATPTLSTGVGMGRYFDALVQPIGVKELIDMGYLVPGRYFGPSEPDLTGVRTVAGDFEKKGLDRVMNNTAIIGDVVDNWMRIAGDKKTMVFAVNVKHSKALRDEFKRHYVKAEHLDAYSEDEERAATIERFRMGDTQVLCNVGLYTEGTDIPEIECISLARPTKSFGLYLQMVGRGARPSEGKKEFIVIDHGGCIRRLGFYEDEIEWSLDGKKPAHRKKQEKHKEKKLMTCERCGCVFYGPVCTTCGYEVKHYGKKIAAIEAELEEITKGKERKQATMEDKRRFYRMLEYHRREKGYAPGWSAHKFKEKFGVWPKGFKGESPIEPDTDFSNYMRHLRIKWAKSKYNPKNSTQQGNGTASYHVSA